MIQVLSNLLSKQHRDSGTWKSIMTFFGALPASSVVQKVTSHPDMHQAIEAFSNQAIANAAANETVLLVLALFLMGGSIARAAQPTQP